MRKIESAAIGFVACLLAACIPEAPQQPPPAQPPLATDAQIADAEAAPAPEGLAEMNGPFAPFQLLGNIYYVGASDLAAFLIVSNDGLIVLDGGLPQTAPRILENIRALGFDVRNVKFLLNSHAHIDHAGGLAALQRASGASFVASEADRGALEAGLFPYGPSSDLPFPPIRVDRVIADGETVTLGDVTLTAHITPGHTQGCTSWSMDTTGADGARHRVFFHCSASVGGQSLVPESYPGMVADYRVTFARVRGMEADVFLANHASFFGLAGRRARQEAGDANAFVDPAALQRFNTAMERQFDAELSRQQAAAH